MGCSTLPVDLLDPLCSRWCSADAATVNREDPTMGQLQDASQHKQQTPPASALIGAVFLHGALWLTRTHEGAPLKGAAWLSLTVM